MGRQLQLHHLAGDEAVVRLRHAGAAEDHMVKGVDGVLLRRLPVGGGVGHHVGAHHDGHLPPREGRPQAGQVLGVGDVHREVLREDVDVELIRHGDGGDAPADAVGLGLFGPGELVDGQHHLIAHVPDGLDDALVGQGEGVEGPGEKGHPLALLEPEAAVEQLLPGDELVDPPQHGAAVVEGQLVPRLLGDEGQQLFQGQQEGPALLVAAQELGAEHGPAQHEHGLLAHLAAEARQPLQQHPQQPFPAVPVDLVLLREPDPVGVVGLVHDAHGIQGPGHHLAVGGGQILRQLPQDLLQLGGRQPQAQPPQIAGDVLGKLLLADLQAPGQLHRHLVALVHGEQRRDLQQGRPRPVADGDPVADLDEVCQVGGHMEQAVPLRPGEGGQQADVHLLDDPGRGGLQVVQEDLRHRLLRQLQRRGAAPQLRQALLPAAGQGGAVAAGHRQQGVLDDVPGGNVVLQIPQQLHRRGPDRQILPAAEGGGEVEEVIALPVGAHLHGQGGGGLQQLEGGLVPQPLRPAVVPQEGGQECLPPVRLALLQQGVHHQLQRKGDPPPVLGHELAVRVDDLVQVQPPLVHSRHRLPVGHVVRGLLLHIPRLEPGDDLPHEGRALAADVALPVHQQLVQKGQGLDLLGHAEIHGVGLEHPQVGPQPPPVRLAPGLLQQPGKAPLAGEAVHELHVVGHAEHLQLLHRLLLVHEGHILGLPGRPVGAGQGHVHPLADHILLKIPQLGVDEGVALALFLRHVVQLGQDHIKGLPQRGDAGDLPAVRPPVLLHPEVGVNKGQGLRRQVIQLQVPDRVVGGHIPQVGDVAAAEPLVGIEVVEIGHPLPRLAAELAEVVAGGGG